MVKFIMHIDATINILKITIPPKSIYDLNANTSLEIGKMILKLT